MAVRPKDLTTRTCQYVHCGKKFVTSNYKRKYFSFACSEDAQGGADRHNGRMEKDPTPEEIADMCRQMLSGELVIGSPNRPMPNWFMEKKSR